MNRSEKYRGCLSVKTLTDHDWVNVDSFDLGEDSKAFSSFERLKKEYPNELFRLVYVIEKTLATNEEEE